MDDANGATLRKETRSALTMFFCGSALLVCALMSFLILCLWEWECYSNYIGLRWVPSSLADKAIIFWALWAKTMALLVPGLVIAAGLAWLRLARTATVVVLINIILLVAWSVIDSLSLGNFGCHIADFISPGYVKGIMGQIIPHLHRNFLAISAVTAVAGISIILVYFSTRRLFSWLVERWEGILKPKTAGVISLVLIGVVLVPLPLTRALSDDSLWTKLCLAMPVAPFFPEWAQGKACIDPAAPDVAMGASLCRDRLKDAFEVGPLDTQAFVNRPDMPHVVLIIVESFRAAEFENGFMPKLKAMASKGLVLANHHSGGNQTPTGLFSILYGRSPVVRDAVFGNQVQPQLCQSLRRCGYDTSFMISEWNWHGFGIEQVLNTDNFDRLVQGPSQEVGLPESDSRILDQASKLMGQGRTKPHGILVFLASTTNPFQYPERFEIFKPASVSLFQKAQFVFCPDDLRNRYKNTLAFLDNLIADFISSLDLSRTVVMITGDHGESLGEDGFLWHGGCLSSSQFRVPFFAVGSGVPQARITDPTTHYDIVPTLLHIIGGTPKPVAHCHGVDVLDGKHGRRLVDMMPRYMTGMRSVIVSGNEHRILYKVGSVEGQLASAPEPFARLDATGRIVDKTPSIQRASGNAQENLR